MTDTADREIADLLPWYETGRLAPADRARVEAALARDPALRRELALVREEMAATVAVNEALGAPSRRAAENFFARLEASPRGGARLGLLRFVTDKLEALRPQTLAWGAMAALALVAIQAGVIAHLASSGGSGGSAFQTASVPRSAPRVGPTLLVAFVPGTNAGALQALLEENDLTIVGGPAAGYFSLAASRDLPAAKVEELIGRLKAHKDVIRSVMLQSAPD